MTTIYKAGGVKSDTPVGFRLAFAIVSGTTRVIMKDETGADFQVTAGKTFYIGFIHWMGFGGVNIILRYDDDGAGTNERQIVWLPKLLMSPEGVFYDRTIDCVIGVAAGKYLTASADVAGSGIVIVNGQEV